MSTLDLQLSYIRILHMNFTLSFI